MNDVKWLSIITGIIGLLLLVFGLRLTGIIFNGWFGMGVILVIAVLILLDIFQLDPKTKKVAIATLIALVLVPRIGVLLSLFPRTAIEARKNIVIRDRRLASRLHTPVPEASNALWMYCQERERVLDEMITKQYAKLGTEVSKTNPDQLIRQLELEAQIKTGIPLDKDLELRKKIKYIKEWAQKCAKEFRILTQNDWVKEWFFEIGFWRWIIGFAGLFLLGTTAGLFLDSPKITAATIVIVILLTVLVGAIFGINTLLKIEPKHTATFAQYSTPSISYNRSNNPTRLTPRSKKDPAFPVNQRPLFLELFVVALAVWLGGELIAAVLRKVGLGFVSSLFIFVLRMGIVFILVIDYPFLGAKYYSILKMWWFFWWYGNYNPAITTTY